MIHLQKEYDIEVGNEKYKVIDMTLETFQNVKSVTLYRYPQSVPLCRYTIPQTSHYERHRNNGRWRWYYRDKHNSMWYYNNQYELDIVINQYLRYILNKAILE